MATKIEEIYAELLPELAANGIEDTPTHRMWALEGLYDAWKEDPETSTEKTLWMMALQAELWSLRLKLMFPSLTTGN